MIRPCDQCGGTSYLGEFEHVDPYTGEHLGNELIPCPRCADMPKLPFVLTPIDEPSDWDDPEWALQAWERGWFKPDSDTVRSYCTVHGSFWSEWDCCEKDYLYYVHNWAAQEWGNVLRYRLPKVTVGLGGWRYPKHWRPSNEKSLYSHRRLYFVEPAGNNRRRNSVRGFAAPQPDRLQVGQPDPPYRPHDGRSICLCKRSGRHVLSVSVG